MSEIYEQYLKEITHSCDDYTACECFYGVNLEIRSKLDYKYHRRYAKQRQMLQDEIVEKFLAEGKSTEHPRIIFTAGAMGAGKSYAIKHLKDVLEIAREDFLYIDPDRIKEELPEYQLLKKTDPLQAGSRVHEESGFIEEILLFRALELNKNVIVDGSLRDFEWNGALITKLRVQYPHYRPMHIIYVYADTDKIIARTEKRGKVTGRFVPRETLLNTLEAVPHTVEILKWLVERTWFICNNDVPEVNRVHDTPADLLPTRELRPEEVVAFAKEAQQKMHQHQSK